MPKENKKRGRRAEKRKQDELDQNVADSPDSFKRQKPNDFEGIDTDDIHPNHGTSDHDRPFFGMLDEAEQEYFKSADDLLEANTFANVEERDIFLMNVYKEADGKEIKIALSQSCSRLMERLIQLSTTKQLKTLFRRFDGNFMHLATHRFASHCCEALFLRAARSVADESEESTSSRQSENDGESYVSMEELFLRVLDEFKGNLGYLINERYASHVLRVLFLVLSGEPFDDSMVKQLLQGKRKEHVSIQGAEDTNSTILRKSRTVPSAFSDALSLLIQNSVAGLTTDDLRALATHPNGGPTLQLLMKLELTHLGKQRAKDERSIIRQLLPDDPITAESGSATFINGIVYDQTGSHLVEQIIQYAPAKMFKALYTQYFHDRLENFSRNEIATYVVCSLLHRLGRDALYDAHEKFIPLLQGLLEQGRTTLTRKLIERCAAREIDTQVIAYQIEQAFSGGEGFDVVKFLHFYVKPQTLNGTPHDSVHSSVMGSHAVTPQETSDTLKIRFNTLAQTMLVVPGSLSALILDAMVSLDSEVIQAMAKDTIVCRTLQASLITANASIIHRRKLVQHFYGAIGEMAADKSASHVVDCIWEGTHGLAFIRERIAEELAENEAVLRELTHGRAVWRNWKMDIYKRRRSEWVRQSKIKASNDGFQSFSEIDSNKKGDAPRPNKTRLELARERHAKTNALKRQAKPQHTGSRDDEGNDDARPQTVSARDESHTPVQDNGDSNAVSGDHRKRNSKATRQHSRPTDRQDKIIELTEQGRSTSIAS